MEQRTKDKLIEITNLIIEEEQLPKIKKVHFKNPLYGATRKFGHLRKIRTFEKKNEFEYDIMVITRKANFVKHSDGKYRDKEGNKYVKTFGVEVPLDEIKQHLAHEIAHLKYWRHSKEHKDYTNYIKEMLNSKLINYMIEVE